MTIFGHDVSDYQSGVDVSRLGARFIIAKTCQGAGTFRDNQGNLKHYGTSRASSYGMHKANARRGGKLFGAYIYLGSDISAAANAALHASVEPDRSIPVMVDWENGSGNAAFLKACVAELGKLGYRVNLTYAPQWYLNQQGGDLQGLPPVVSSKYPDYTPRSVSAAYAARTGSAWNSYGGNTTIISQFTSTGRDPAYPGTNLDCLAFNGSDGDLAALFGAAGGGSAPGAHAKSGEDVAQIFSYDPCPRGSDGKLATRNHTFVLPVGSNSQVTANAWLSFKCMNAPGGAEHVELMSIRGDDKAGLPGGQYPVDKGWDNVAADHTRVYIQAADGQDQFVAYVRSEKPYSLCIEIQPK